MMRLFISPLAFFFCLLGFGQSHVYEGEYEMPNPQFDANPFFKDVVGANEIVNFIKGDTHSIDKFDDKARKIQVIAFRDGKRSTNWHYTFDEKNGYQNFSHEPFDKSKSYYSKTKVIVKINKWGKNDSTLEIITPFRNQEQLDDVFRGTQFRYNEKGQIIEKWHKYHSSYKYEYEYAESKLKSVFVYNPKGQFGNHYELKYDKHGKVTQVINLYRSINWETVDSGSIENYKFKGDKLIYFNYKSLNPGSSVSELREFWYDYNDLGNLTLLRLKKGNYEHSVVFRYEKDKLVEASCDFEQDIFHAVYSLQARNYLDGQKHKFVVKYGYNPQDDCISEVKTIDGRNINSRRRDIIYR